MEVVANFTERLRQLRDESGKTQSQIAKELGMTPQAFSYFVNGREPNYETLGKLADYFQVSTDYLLGKTDVKATHVSQRILCEMTGLSEKVITLLVKDAIEKKESGMSLYGKLINALFQSEYFSSFMGYFVLYQSTIHTFLSNDGQKAPWITADMDSPEMEKIIKIVAAFNEISGSGVHTLYGLAGLRYYENEITNIFRKMIPEMAGFHYDDPEDKERLNKLETKWNTITDKAINLILPDDIKTVLDEIEQFIFGPKEESAKEEEE